MRSQWTNQIKWDKWEDETTNIFHLQVGNIFPMILHSSFVHLLSFNLISFNFSSENRIVSSGNSMWDTRYDFRNPYVFNFRLTNWDIFQKYSAGKKWFRDVIPILLLLWVRSDLEISNSYKSYYNSLYSLFSNYVEMKYVDKSHSTITIQLLRFWTVWKRKNVEFFLPRIIFLLRKSSWDHKERSDVIFYSISSSIFFSFPSHSIHLPIIIIYFYSEYSPNRNIHRINLWNGNVLSMYLSSIYLSMYLS